VRWLPWHRVKRAELTGYTLANVKAEKIKRGHWRITIGPENPHTYEFWGTEEQPRIEMAKRDEEVQRVRRQAIRAWKAQQALLVLQRAHEKDRHVGASIADCARCQELIQRAKRYRR
jgi:hypothetical protein